MADGRIFINYRRDDSRADAGRIYDRLSLRFPGKVFRDVGSLEPGVEWQDAIERVLGTSDACVVVIGKSWLSVTDAAGRRRLDDPNDTVRAEIRSALARKMRVIPVLVGGASMPSEADLPEDIRALCRRNALEVTEQDWDENLNKLTRALEQALGVPAAEVDGGGHSRAKVSGRFSLFHGRLVFAFAATLGVSLLVVSVAVYQNGRKSMVETLADKKAASGATPDVAFEAPAARPLASRPSDSSGPSRLPASAAQRSSQPAAGETAPPAPEAENASRPAVAAAPPLPEPRPPATDASALAGVWSMTVGNGSQQLEETVILFPDGSYRVMAPGAPAAAVGKWRLNRADNTLEFFGVNLLNLGVRYQCTMGRTGASTLSYSGTCQDERGSVWHVAGTRTAAAGRSEVVIPGLNLEGLTDAEKEAFSGLLNNSPCTCGCGKNLLACRLDEAERCGNSLLVARQMLTQFMALVRR